MTSAVPGSTASLDAEELLVANMDGNSWLWIALMAFLVLCCLPMLFMGRHGKRSIDTPRKDDGNQSSGPRDKLTGAK